MRQFVSATLVGSCLISGLILSLGAQSLADVARKEEERRKTIHEPAKVYTNKDLASPPPSSAPAAKTAETKEDPVAARAKDAKDKGQDPAKDAAKEKEPVKDKAYWAGRQKALQDQIDRDKTYADALQSRINALSADFVNRDDPAQRDAIERDRLKAIAELNRLKQTIPQDQKALADFQEEARRAGVPPGWLR